MSDYNLRVIISSSKRFEADHCHRIISDTDNLTLGTATNGYRRLISGIQVRLRFLQLSDKPSVPCNGVVIHNSCIQRSTCLFKIGKSHALYLCPVGRTVHLAQHKPVMTARIFSFPVESYPRLQSESSSSSSSESESRRRFLETGFGTSSLRTKT